jgi:hypothetical protein
LFSCSVREGGESAWTRQELCDDPVLSRLQFEIELDKCETSEVNAALFTD